MNCNCINDYKNWLIETTGDPMAQWDLETELIKGEIVEFIPVYAFYKDIRKRDGKLGKRSRHKIIPTHCPFCGKENRIGEREDLLEDDES